MNLTNVESYTQKVVLGRSSSGPSCSTRSGTAVERRRLE